LGSDVTRDRQPPTSADRAINDHKSTIKNHFSRRVLAAVRRIPPGRVSTYGDIAAMAGSPRAWRAVGTVMRECRDPSVPCHRVVGSGGTLGGYSSLSLKRDLLRAEGLEVGPRQVRQFAAVRWSHPNRR
jgi:O-6-methylguanine DNA methyltransferase